MLNYYTKEVFIKEQASYEIDEIDDLKFPYLSNTDVINFFEEEDGLFAQINQSSSSKQDFKSFSKQIIKNFNKKEKLTRITNNNLIIR